MGRTRFSQTISPIFNSLKLIAPLEVHGGWDVDDIHEYFLHFTNKIASLRFFPHIQSDHLLEFVP